jgi:c-di-GMP-binding flagellar brake protein YcgR
MNLQPAKTSAPKHAPKVPYDLEVIPLLRRIKRGGALIAVHNEGMTDPVLASIKEVNGATGHLRLLCKGDPAHALAVFAAAGVTVNALSGTTKLQFRVTSYTIVANEPEVEVDVELGEHMLSYDRRRFYRMAVPVAEHVRCMISFVAEGGALAHLQMGVLDLSEGGLALLCNPNLIDMTPGTRYRDCRVELPGADAFVVTLEVRNVVAHDSDHNNWVRMGCAFVDLSGVEQMLIRHYIDRLEYEWRDWLPSLDFAQAA